MLFHNDHNIITLLCTFLILINIIHITIAVQDDMLRKIKSHYPEFIPESIIDIGANKGEWSIAARKTFPSTKILMLEATPDKDEILKGLTTANGPLNTNTEYHIEVLSSKDNEKVTFFQGGDTGNSMFRENTKYYAKDKPVERITKTVDTIIYNSKLMKNIKVDFIKADVQGAELVALQGASAALEQATFVQLEGSTIEYNSGGACLYQVDAFLRSKGFYLYDFGDLAVNPSLFGTKGVGQFDILYIKPTSTRIPNYLKDTKFCGQGRDPLDLPGVNPKMSTTTSRKTTEEMMKMAEFPELNNNNDATTSSTYDFYSGVFVGCFIGIIGFYLLDKTKKVKKEERKV